MPSTVAPTFMFLKESLCAMLEKYGGERYYQLIIIEATREPDREIHKELMTKEAIAMMMASSATMASSASTPPTAITIWFPCLPPQRPN